MQKLDWDWMGQNEADCSWGDADSVVVGIVAPIDGVAGVVVHCTNRTLWFARHCGVGWVVEIALQWVVVGTRIHVVVVSVAEGPASSC